MSFNRHLLVDGANVLHSWPEFAALLKRDRDAARSQFVRTVAAIHDAEEVRVTIVFDGRGDAIALERPTRQLTFSVIYTPASLTADDVIEQMVANSADPTACFVVTGDHAERETVVASGANALRPADLAAWVAQAESRQNTHLDTLNRQNRKAWRRP